ncbi:UNVERIFIED_CONTAM: hypothetical protein Sradi_5075600 [Sesamum radiatum]|uniref:RNase H type-1 domain-containing protein n=1 Tax=Sesamum radiatum TaxID=300843 RepID=A0AAW2M1U7_SESRA
MGFVFRQTLLRAPSVVRWSTPSPSWFKLNTDGCSLGNPGPAGVAGIIRGSDGCIHLTFQVTLGTGTSVIFELTTVWRGLELALAHALAPLVVEVDANAVIQLLQSRASGKWRRRMGQLIILRRRLPLQLNWVLRNSDITGGDGDAAVGDDRRRRQDTGRPHRRLSPSPCARKHRRPHKGARLRCRPLMKGWPPRFGATPPQIWAAAGDLASVQGFGHHSPPTEKKTFIKKIKELIAPDWAATRRRRLYAEVLGAMVARAESSSPSATRRPTEKKTPIYFFKE